MNVRRRQQVRTAVCFALPALALALCGVLGLSATAGAHPATDRFGHAAMAPAPHRPLPAIMRMQDPIGFDLVAADDSVQTAHPADPASTTVASARVIAEHGTARSRAPPGGEPV